MFTPHSPAIASPIDLELVAQRVRKLAEIATLEHLVALSNSQADGLLACSHENADLSLLIRAEPKG